MMNKNFNWTTEFKGIIVVDGELFHNNYTIKTKIRPITANLPEQNLYFERLKLLYQVIFNNCVITSRNEPLYDVLQKHTTNRFIELPKPPYDQIMAAVCFTKSNAILEGKIIIDSVELQSFQGDGISYTVEKDFTELHLLDVDNWFSSKYNKFDPWWLRSDTATYDKELSKGIYTGHFPWNPIARPDVEKKNDQHAKIFEFNAKVVDGGQDKNK
jgi:hypothetical protein